MCCQCFDLVHAWIIHHNYTFKNKELDSPHVDHNQLDDQVPCKITYTNHYTEQHNIANDFKFVFMF